MFTGIIEEIGTMHRVAEQQDIHIYNITAGTTFVKSIKNGDSISVNGVCLTAYDIDSDKFNVDVSLETQRCTAFANFSDEARVNLERSVTPDTRLGGHFVSGHVDATTKLVEREDNENETIIWVSTPSELYKYIAVKGSVCINGVSLTVNQIKQDRHCITIIPHTLKNTNLGDIKINDLVNIEVDLIARYLEQLSQNN